eukprot:TRINITY_DN82211_c0_g1_i1.p1 TRINITY_DN82211_c0_g1~~TRINITY_DN82211_c0_g1_i1.p1  ORF type:complete len:391 (+),score=65.24 TRINITY_DN82211_c0_g1_i1:170-1342(+)
MAHFFMLQNRLGDVVAEYFQKTQDASDRLAEEMKAVIKLQSFWRACKDRQKWHATQAATMLVQRVSRGWLARCRTTMRRRERIRRQNMLFFNHCAAVIQKFFRGWWSRRHLHNYYGRKGYLQKVAKRGDWTRTHLSSDHAKKVQAAKMAEEDQMRHQFHNLAGELHHLVSTKSIPGVYNPPYNDVLPRAFDKPIEQHLRDSLQVRLPRALRRPRYSGSTGPSPRLHGYGATQNDHINSLGAIRGPPQDLPDRIPHHSRSASVGRMQNIQGPFRSREQIEVSNSKAHNNFRSVQSASPYDAVTDDRKMQQRLAKLTRVSPIDFMAPGCPPINPVPTSLHTSVPYREKPCELRSDYVELPKIRDKPPFFTSVTNGKNFEDYTENNLLPFGHV